MRRVCKGHAGCPFERMAKGEGLAKRDLQEPGESGINDFGEPQVPEGRVSRHADRRQQFRSRGARGRLSRRSGHPRRAASSWRKRGRRGRGHGAAGSSRTGARALLLNAALSRLEISALFRSASKVLAGLADLRTEATVGRNRAWGNRQTCGRVRRS